ncbi:hypothetical protein HGRIS_009839 [Hohenbuehelia grisea]|uniref:AB hydrolase-1 domain-containing protein n=1 Tax=Hohenbuehelia grisea TaxID=104357 RepID=A0ABR3J2G8_9AGAR
MPWVDIRNADDRLSIWYITNTLHNNVGAFDPEKPTIIIMHPVFLCTRWLDNQFGDPRLDAGYNLIAFDNRVSGRSSARPSGKHDCWVQAADMALFMQRLRLPPSHILALEAMSTTTALRFAALFPEMCLSLTLCNVPAPTEQKYIYTAYIELLESWVTAEDLDTFENVAKESASFVAGLDCDLDLCDDLIRYWELNMPPTRAQRVTEHLNVLMNRTPLSPETLERITQPVLILHAERNETCPLKFADKLAEQLINVPGHAIVYTVKGASGCLGIVPGHASIANQVFMKFLSRLPPARSDFLPLSMPTRDRMHQALFVLSQITGDRSATLRDPMSSLSFSCVSPDVLRRQEAMLVQYGLLESYAFSPLDRDGFAPSRYAPNTNMYSSLLTDTVHSDILGASKRPSTGSTAAKTDTPTLVTNAVVLSEHQKYEPEPEPLPPHLPLPKPSVYRPSQGDALPKHSRHRSEDPLPPGKDRVLPAPQEPLRSRGFRRRNTKGGADRASKGFTSSSNLPPVTVSFDKAL